MIRKTNIIGGIALIALGYGLMEDPVNYSSKFAYDLRGGLHLVVSFIAIYIGIWLLLKAYKKAKLIKYYCPVCGNTKGLAEESLITCNLCKVALKKIEDTRDEP